MASSLNILSGFDHLVQLYDISNPSCLEDFLRYTTSQEECRLKWLDSARELQRQKKTQNEMRKEINGLELKLTTARKLLDQEKCKRIRAEEDKNNIERQLQLVRELLFADTRNHLHDETREKLKFLNSTVRSRISNDYNDRLSAIQELDSTGSILSDLSFSRSEDDLDMESFMRKKRTYKKQRPSVVGYEEQPSAKRRRSSRILELNKNDGLAERMVATTTVTMEHDGSMSAQSQIETIPSNVNYAPSAPIRTSSLESVESGLSIENNTKYNRDLNKDVGVLPIGLSKVNARSHLFTSKTVIRPEECDVCEKRIKFSCTVLRCQNCRASCHPGCKEELPLPCIAPGNTPISKKNMGVIADYAPTCPPMVPALVIHCVREVEDRGLTEPGIYRLSGSDKDVKALKERFMRNRGVPPLVDLDIHVVCGCLKDFMRSLREPLVTHKLWWDFVQAAEICDLEERRAKLVQAVSQLPQPNRDTLAYIILHLLRVAESKEANKMDVSNLATVMGPTVVGYSSDCSNEEMYAQVAKAKMVLEQFLLMSAEYWFRVMSNPHINVQCATPLSVPNTRSHRTPSTRSIRNFFLDTPSHH